MKSRRFLANAAVTLLLAGAACLASARFELLGAAATPAEIVVVEETRDLLTLPQAQLAMLGSPALRRAMAASRIAFQRVDKDASGPDVPTWAIYAAKNHPLPSWVARSKSGRVTVRPCPTNEAEALRAIGGN